MHKIILTLAIGLFAPTVWADVVPLGNTEGYVLVDTETQLLFVLNEGTFVDCTLDTGLPNLKIESCKIENGSFTLNGKTYTLTNLVRNFEPNIGSTPLYQYQYIGVWEKNLPNFTVRFKMVVTINTPGLNVPRMNGFINVPEMSYTKQLVARKI